MLDFESRYASDLSTMMDMHEVMLHQLATYAYNAQAYDILYRALVGNRAYFDATFRQSGMLGTYDEAVGLALNTFQEPMTADICHD